jgi:hypothetical protein
MWVGSVDIYNEKLPDLYIPSSLEWSDCTHSMEGEIKSQCTVLIRKALGIPGFIYTWLSTYDRLPF